MKRRKKTKSKTKGGEKRVAALPTGEGLKDTVFTGFVIIAFLLIAAKVFGLTFSLGL